MVEMVVEVRKRYLKALGSKSDMRNWLSCCCHFGWWMKKNLWIVDESVPIWTVIYRWIKCAWIVTECVSGGLVSSLSVSLTHYISFFHLSWSTIGGFQKERFPNILYPEPPLPQRMPLSSTFLYIFYNVSMIFDVCVENVIVFLYLDGHLFSYYFEVNRRYFYFIRTVMNGLRMMYPIFWLYKMSKSKQY